MLYWSDCWQDLQVLEEQLENNLTRNLTWRNVELNLPFRMVLLEEAPCSKNT